MWCKKIFILCGAKYGGIAFLIVAHIFSPVELTPLWIWYEVAGSLKVLRQTRAQGVSLESSGGTFTYPGPPPPALSKLDRQAMVKMEGRGHGFGHCAPEVLDATRLRLPLQGAHKWAFLGTCPVSCSKGPMPWCLNFLEKSVVELQTHKSD